MKKAITLLAWVAAFSFLRAQCPSGWATFYVVGPSSQNPTGAVLVIEQSAAPTFISLNGGPPISFSDRFWIENLSAGSAHSVVVTDATGCVADTSFGVVSGCNEPFISEYVEGSSNNKALEIYNPTAVPVNLSSYKICTYYNAGPSAGVFQLSGTISAYGTHVVAHASAAAPILAVAQQTQPGGTGTALQFNGNDAVALFKYSGTDSVLIDMFGVKFQNPTNGWTDPSGAVVTENRTLVRKPQVRQGRTTNLNVFIPTEEWNVFPENTFDFLGGHVSECQSGGGAVCNITTVPHLSVEGGCVGDPLLITANYPYPYDYLLILGPDGRVYLEEVLFSSAMAEMSGTYRAVALFQGCASVIAETEVFVSQPSILNVQVVGQTQVCAGDTMHLTAQVTGGTGAVTWTAPGGQTFQGPVLNPVNPVSGTWTVTVTPGCGPAAIQPFTVSVVVVNSPDVTSNSPVEIGGTVELNAGFTPPGNVFWTGPNGFTAQGPNVQIPNADAFDSGEYLAYVVAHGCTSAASSVTVLVGTGDCDFDFTYISVPATPGHPGAVLVTVNGGAALPYAYTVSLPGGPNIVTGVAQQSPFTLALPAHGEFDVRLDAGCNDTTFTVSIPFIDPLGCRDLFISEYLEGFSRNKAIEIYNPTNTVVNLSNYKLWTIFNQGNPNQRRSLQLQGTISPQGTHVVAHDSAWQEIVNLANRRDTLVVNFNGNDAVLLVKYNSPTDTVVLDVFGVPGQNPVDGWGAPGGEIVTKDRTLRRKAFVQSGRPAGASFNPLQEWDVFPVNTYSGLGQHTSTCSQTAPCTPPGTPVAGYDPVCVGEDLRLRAVVAPGTQYVLWHGPGGFAAVVDSVAIVPNVSAQNSGVYFVVAYGNGCASPGAAVNVSVGQNINVSVNGTAVSSQVCEGGTISLNATGTPGAVFSWTGPNGFSSSIAGPTIAQATPAQSGPYVVAAFPANGCGNPAYDTVTVVVTPRPSSPQVSNGQITLNVGQTLTLSADGPTGAVLLWSGPAGFSAEGTTVTRPNVSANHAGTYNVVAVVQGCSSLVATVQVEVLTSRFAALTLNHQIYPNPSDDGRFVLSLDQPVRSLSVEVFDAAGRCVWRHATSGKETEILLKSAGVYVLKVVTERGTAGATLIRH
jgi:hypothetical protein